MQKKHLWIFAIIALLTTGAVAAQEPTSEESVETEATAQVEGEVEAGAEIGAEVEAGTEVEAGGELQAETETKAEAEVSSEGSYEETVSHSELPQTASALPFLGLFGLAALAGVGLLSFLRRKDDA